MITLKTLDELNIMRENGKLLACVMKNLINNVKPNITTKQLDVIAYNEIIKNGAKPSFLGYSGFPATICASINNEVVHGISKETRILKEGDIISIDIGLHRNDFHVDMAVTVPVGSVDDRVASLVSVTKESLNRGIKQCIPGKTLGDIGFAVQTFVESNAFNVVRDYAGHGIGRMLHEDPQVPNFGYPNQGIKLKAGMVLAIEPMVNIGTWQIKVLNDGWTVVTNDGKRSAHFEHTIVITNNEPEILTKLV